MITGALLALLFAALVALGIERLKYEAAKPAMAQVDLALNSVTAMIAGSNGYTLYYVLQDGTMLGTTEGGQFSPSSFWPGKTVMYGSREYQVVEVKDEWPSAIGTLILRKALTEA